MSKKKELPISPITQKLLPTKLEFAIDQIIQPNFLRKVFVVRNLPESIKGSNKTVFLELMQTPNTTISMRLSHMDAMQVKNLVDKQINDVHTGLFKRKVTDQIKAQGDLEELKEFYRDCQKTSANGSAMKYLNIFIEIYGSNQEELSKNIKKLHIRCQSLGVSIEECYLRQKEGFVGVCPIGSDTRGKLLANNIPSNTLGQLYMFSSSSLNDPHGMILGKTVDNGMMSLDIWLRTATRTNSNIIVIGDSGQGKSHLLKKIISQQRPRNTVIFVIDAENEFSTLCRKLNGTNINCAKGNFVLNPLEIRHFRNANDDEEGWDADISAFSADNSPFFQHLSWLTDFYKVLIPSLSSRHNTEAVMQLNALKIFTQDLYNKFGITEETDLSKLSATDYPIFSDLYAYILDVCNNPLKYDFYKMIDSKVIMDLLLLLHDVYKGSLSPLFNKHTNIPNSDYINLNILELLSGSLDNTQAVLFNFLTYIWGRVITKKQKVMLVIDELHLFLNGDNPTVVKYLNSFVRRTRKYDASLIPATQKIMDCLDERIALHTAAIFDTPTYKFLFYPGTVDFDKMKNKLHLSDGEVSSISVSNQGNCLLKIADDKYHVKIGLLPYERELFGSGGGR